MPEVRSNVAVHTISLRGYAGAIFILIVVATVFFAIGFATPNWSAKDGARSGLWESCACVEHNNREDWFIAFQVLICCALAGLGICLLLICLYMCVHSVSKNSTIKALVAFCFISVIIMLTGFILYGVKMDNLHWSFGVSVVGAFFTLLAGAFSIVQMRDSGVSLI